ncbi:hypothetical protein RRF57_000042 [Xylaria bambusicola]|uniref:Uncharacterized protein n=1 Tax=Xylaria bambusicola TaxID=326684 RepID=A0AAN7UC76_9PEZI
MKKGLFLSSATTSSTVFFPVMARPGESSGNMAAVNSADALPSCDSFVDVTAGIDVDVSD